MFYKNVNTNYTTANYLNLINTTKIGIKKNVKAILIKSNKEKSIMISTIVLAYTPIFNFIEIIIIVLIYL